MNQLPDLSLSFKKMRLIDQIEDNCDQNTLIGISMLNAIWSKTQPNEILKTFADIAKNNLLVMQKQFGEDLCNEILAL